jgi:tetratricopeptide (TPR) repeat protein
LKQKILAEPVLVGRERELEQLQHYLESATKGQGITIFVSGEAGSGKTRLITEFLKTARKKDVTVLTGWCLSDAAIPYFPFVEAFDSSSATINQKLGLQSWLLESGESLAGERHANIQPEAWKDQAFYRVSKELLFLSAKKPLILTLEDIHWADSASLSLIHYLARQVVSERILILATYRKEELNVDVGGQPNPLSNALLLMGRDDLFREVKLPNLSIDDVRRIAENMLGGNIQPKLVEKLSSDSHGNPLYVVESLRMLYQHGNLSKKKGHWSLSTEDFDVPRKVRDVILRRLEALRPDQRKIIDVASVVGEKFDPKLVASTISRDNADVLITLNEIAKRTLIVHSEDNAYRFEHAKFREMLYEEIPSLLRREYQTRIAEELEVASQHGVEVSVSDLAYHFVLADNKAKANKYSLQAGRAALAQFSNVEAIRHFSNVLNIAKDNRDFTKERANALEGLGDAYAANCMYTEAIKIFDKLAESETGTLKLRAIRKAMDAAFLLGDKPDLLLEYARNAEELALDDRLEMARVLKNRGRAFSWAARGDAKLDMADYEKALQIFEEENSLVDVAEALWRRGEVFGPRVEVNLGSLLRSRAIFRELGDIRKEIKVSLSMGSSLNFLGLYPEAKREFIDILEVGEKIGVFDELARASGLLGLLDEFEGKYADALSRVLKALEYAKKTDAKYIQGLDLAALTRLYSMLGDLKRADEFFDRMEKLPPEVLLTPLVRLMVPVSKGIYFGAKGRLEESNRVFEALAKEFGEEDTLGRYYMLYLEMQGRIEEAKFQRDKVQKVLERAQERFVHANVQLSVMVPKKVKVGEVFEMRLDLVNVAKNPATPVKVEGLVPSGCKVISLPSSCSLQNSSVKMNNVGIGPFQVETIKLRVAFVKAGVCNLNPVISYADDLGKARTGKSKPVTITVQIGSLEDKTKSTAEPPEVQFEFKSEAAEKAFNFLVRAFQEDYMTHRMSQEKSGWRTLMEVVRNAQVTMHSMYGRSGKGGKATRELERSGLVEQRFFLGERGRGGRVLKMRICYEKEPVKRRITRQRD